MTAAKFIPLALEVIEFQFPVGPLGVQELPESVLMYNAPPVAPDTAANIVPSALEVIDVQNGIDVRLAVRRIQVSPELLLVYTFAVVISTAANFIPSALEAIDVQVAVIADVLVQLTP